MALTMEGVLKQTCESPAFYETRVEILNVVVSREGHSTILKQNIHRIYINHNAAVEKRNEVFVDTRLCQLSFYLGYCVLKYQALIQISDKLEGRFA